MKSDRTGIVALGAEHEQALVEFLADFSKNGEAEIPAYFPSRDWPHARIVRALREWSRGEGLSEGWVPSTTRFFIENGAVLGVYNFRHRLSVALESFGGHVGYSVRPSARGRGVASALLLDARRLGHGLGLPSLLVTCGDENHPSRRVIEKNGGVLRDSRWNSQHQAQTLWFDLPTSPQE